MNKKMFDIMTSIGIFIGVVSIILISNVGGSISKYISNIYFDNERLIQVQQDYSQLDYSNYSSELNFQNLSKIKNLEYIDEIYINTGTYFEIESHKIRIELFHEDYNLEKFYNFNLDSKMEHNFFNIIMEKNLYLKLNKPSSIIINNRNFKIVELYEASNNNLKNTIIMNANAYTSLFEKDFDAITVMYKEGYSPEIIEQLKEEVEINYDELYSVFDYSESKESMEGILSSVTNLFFLFGLTTIIVSGIGIMNLTYINVMHDKNEICVKRAIGANSRDITIEYLKKNTKLVFLSTMFGILFGFSLVFIILKIINIPISITMSSFAIPFIFSFGISTLFGIYPAYFAGTENIIKFL